MKFKEFSKWCNDRCFDGFWGSTEAIICCKICRTIYSKPFWKREKIWRQVYEDRIVHNIVEPTNKIIMEVENANN